MKTKTLSKLTDNTNRLENLFDYLESNDFKETEPPVWNLEEVLMHLYTTEELGYKYLTYKLDQNASFNPLSFKNTLKFKLFLWKANRTEKMKAPEMVSISRDQIGMNKYQIIEKWRALRQKYYTLLNGLDEKYYSLAMFKHPFGRFSLNQMIDFFDYHINRHKKQIQKLEG